VVALCFVLVAAWTLPSLGGPVVREASPLRAGVSNDLVCNGRTWQTLHLAVSLSGCQAVFEVEYAQNFSETPNATNQYNFSFSIPWIAEITPGGGLVRLASPLAPTSSLVNLTRFPGELIVSTLETMNVTNASGTWSPNSTGYGTGTPWNVSNTTVGTTTIGVTFYLFNATNPHPGTNTTENTSLAVEFDLTIGPWPWVRTTDLLGFGLVSLGAWGSHFAYNESSRTLQEEWNSSNRTFASIEFGTGANVSYDNNTYFGQSTVSQQAGAYVAGAPGRESVVLSTFGAVTGGYGFLVYDPWVVFSPGATGPSSHPPFLTVSPSGWPAWVAVSLALVAAVAGLACLAAVVLRGQRLRSEGATLVREMRNAISEPSEPPSRPR